MAFYMDSKRIPPERLVFNAPEKYDRMLNTYDIQGAKPERKPINYDNHGNSLKVQDIPGAQSKKTIREHKYRGPLETTSQNHFTGQNVQAQQAPQIKSQQNLSLSNNQQPQPPSSQNQSYLQNYYSSGNLIQPPSQHRYSNDPRSEQQVQQPTQTQPQNSRGQLQSQSQRQLPNQFINVQEHHRQSLPSQQQQQAQYPVSSQGQSKVWQNHDYDILGNYVREKRVYDRALFANDLERSKLFGPQPGKGATANFSSLPTTTRHLKGFPQEAVNDPEIQNLIQQKPNQPFGRSNLFESHVQAKNNHYVPRNLTHEENVRVADQQHDLQRQYKASVRDQFGASQQQQQSEFADVQTVLKEYREAQAPSAQFGRSDLFSQHHPQGKINIYAQRNITHDSLKEAVINHDQRIQQDKQHKITSSQLNQQMNLPKGNEPTFNDLLKLDQKNPVHQFGRSGLFSDHIQGRTDFYPQRNYTHDQHCLPGTTNNIPDRQDIHKIN